MLDVEIGGIWSIIDLPSFKFQQLHKRQSELVRKAKYVSNIYIFPSLGVSILYLLAEWGRLDPLCFGEFLFSFVFPFLSPPRFTGSAFPSSEQVCVFLAGWYLWSLGIIFWFWSSFWLYFSLRYIANPGIYFFYCYYFIFFKRIDRPGSTWTCRCA